MTVRHTIEAEPRPILVAEGVRKVYRSGADSVVALHGLDLVVPQGEFVAAATVAASLLATVAPALSATRIRPAVALRMTD